MRIARLGPGHALLVAAALWHPCAVAGGRVPEETAWPETVGRARFLMGTRLSIVLAAPAPDAAFEAAFAEVARLEGALSNWREGSEITRLNLEAAGVAFRCSPDLFGAVRAALRWAEATGGAFDPTVEPLVRALGLRDPAGRLPEGPPRDMAGGPVGGTGVGGGPVEAPVGWRHVRVDEASRSVAFDAPGVGLDLGGIGKGFALDAAARVLRRVGFRDALLDFGGQVLAAGSAPAGSPWPVGIAAPGRRSEAAFWIAVRDRSVSTSGNDERAIDGPAGPIGHILDPARRAPALYEGEVTVVAREATMADALSTGLFVMGPDRGCRWAEAHGIAAVFLWRRADGTLEHRESKEFMALARVGAAEADGARGGPARRGRRTSASSAPGGGGG